MAGKKKKSKRCGRGKIADGKGGCRQMSYRELQEVHGGMGVGYAKGAMAGALVGHPAIGAAVGTYIGGKKTKKRLSKKK